MEENEKDIISEVKNQIGLAHLHKLIFGEPISEDKTIIVPVSKVRCGFGLGKGGKEIKTGTGGGGGISATPIGYIEIKDGSSKFVRIPATTLAKIFIAGTTAGYFLWKIIKLLKK